MAPSGQSNSPSYASSSIASAYNIYRTTACQSRRTLRSARVPPSTLYLQRQRMKKQTIVSTWILGGGYRQGQRGLGARGEAPPTPCRCQQLPLPIRGATGVRLSLCAIPVLPGLRGSHRPPLRVQGRAGEAELAGARRHPGYTGPVYIHGLPPAALSGGAKMKIGLFCSGLASTKTSSSHS